MNNPLAGLHDVSQYGVSGYPYLTQSTANASTAVEIKFPQVTRFFTVQVLTSGSVDFAVTENGLDSGHTFRLENSGSLAVELRTPSLFMLAVDGDEDVQVVAGLTGIPAGLMIVTGSDGQEGVG